MKPAARATIFYAQAYTAGGTPKASEFLVNTYTTGNQFAPAVAMDSTGDFVVTWQGQDESGSPNYEIYAQQYNASGAAQGSEFEVNTYTTVGQQNPAVAMDSQGDFVVTWAGYNLGGKSKNYEIFAQQYSRSGVALGDEFEVNDNTAVNESGPSVAMDSTGDFVVAWSSYGEDGGGDGVYANRYNPPVVTTTASGLLYTAGSGAVDVDSGVSISDAESTTLTSATISISASNYVSGEDVLAFANTTNITGSFDSSTGILTLTGADTVADYQAALESVTYEDTANDATFTPRTISFSVNDGISNSLAATRTVTPLDVVTQLVITAQPPSTVSAGGVFGLVVAAEDSQGRLVTTFDGSETVALGANPGSSTLSGTLTISAVNGLAKFNGLNLNAAGSGYTLQVSGNVPTPQSVISNSFTVVSVPTAVVPTEFQVNTYTTGNQQNSKVATDAAGDYVVVWEDQSGEDGNSYGVFAQLYNAAGVPTGSEFQVNTYTYSFQYAPSVAMDAAGDFVIAWASNYEDGYGNGIYAQRYNAAGVPQGSEFQVNTYTTNTQYVPSVAMDAAGAFVVTWASYGQDGSAWASCAAVQRRRHAARERVPGQYFHEQRSDQPVGGHGFGGRLRRRLGELRPSRTWLRRVRASS